MIRILVVIGLLVLLGCAPSPRVPTDRPFVPEAVDDASEPKLTPGSEAPVAVEATEPVEPESVLPEPAEAGLPATIDDDDPSAAAPVAVADQQDIPADTPTPLDTHPDGQCETPSLDPDTRRTLVGAGVRSVLDWERAIAEDCDLRTD